MTKSTSLKIETLANNHFPNISGNQITSRLQPDAMSLQQEL
jgi:hypothetical protein